MLLLVSGATQTPRSARVGHLVVPRSWSPPASLRLVPDRWAMDNDGFNGFDEGAYVRMLEKFAPVPGCLFAPAPDVVGDAAATLDRWPFWSQLLRGIGVPPAFVLQDGITPARVPWDGMAAVFVGGTTAFKESDEVRSLVAYAIARGLWVHWGRVNGQRRYGLIRHTMGDYARCSLDGSSFSKWSKTNIPLVAKWDRKIARQMQAQLAL